MNPSSDKPRKSFRKRIEKKIFGRYTKLNILAAIVGTAAGIVAVGFRMLIDVFKYIFQFFLPQIFSFMGGYYLIVMPALGGIFVGILIYYFAEDAKGEGPPEVIAAVISAGGRLRARVVLVKSIVSAICIGSGGSVGREGPIVHIGSAYGSSLAQALKLREKDIKILVGCGAGAAIAAAFNAPIAGVLFAMEIILREFKTRSFVPIVVAAVFGTIVSRFYLGDFPAFTPPPYEFVSAWELPLYLLLGIIAGFVAIFEVKTILKISDLFERLKARPYVLPAIGGLFVGVIGFAFPQIFGVGYETVDWILSGNIVESSAIKILIALVFFKIIAVAITLGSGGVGGIFAPSLFIGAALGGAFGMIMNILFPGTTASYGAYALVGMAAVFAGASNATLTAILILFEMTQDYKIILPLMFACVVSDAIVVVFYGDSIYSKKVKKMGVKMHTDTDTAMLDTITVRETMVPEEKVMGVKLSDTADEISEVIINTGYQGFPVLNGKGELCGIVTHADIKRALKEGKAAETAKDIETTDLIVTYTDESLNDALRKMGLKDLGHLPVVDRGNPKHLVGWLSRSDILHAYNVKVAEEDFEETGRLEPESSIDYNGLNTLAEQVDENTSEEPKGPKEPEEPEKHQKPGETAEDNGEEGKDEKPSSRKEESPTDNFDESPKEDGIEEKEKKSVKKSLEEKKI